MQLKTDKCPKCGKHNTILPSNNPLVQGVCVYCVTSSLDYGNLEHGDYFCRTYNLPFDPDRWVSLSTNYKEKTFEEYIKWVAAENKDTLYWDNPTSDLWKKLNDEWKLNTTHEELLSKIQPIKEGFLLRNRIKWGVNWSFEEIIMLESLFVNTLKAHDISNPMQIDAIKKACKMSVMLDRAIISQDSKEIKELSAAYSGFIKTANIDELIVASNNDVISTVAELCDFIEKNNFQMEYYDNVERDVVDATINDIKEYLRTLVSESVGLELVFETINNAAKLEAAKEKDNESFEQVSLEELYKNAVDRQNEEFDQELEQDAKDDFDFEDGDDDEFNYFG